MKINALLLACLTIFLFISCTSADKAVIESKETELIENEKTEIIIPEIAPVVEKRSEDSELQKGMAAEKEPIISDADKEYARSVTTLVGTISKDDFVEDKKDIMKTIEELNEIIKKQDYEAWLKYVSPASKQYWNNPKNLAAVASRLPVKGIKIRSMKDYFLYVFIPARQNSKVEEIRYVSPTITKAVEPKEDEDLIFYIFEKSSSGDWLLKLDTI
ncbi:MAG: hypothetical protein GX297_07025 [Treponema sp.]|jgi:hypothetical protein|nr:hypothetical protein [Treponema sp.]